MSTNDNNGNDEDASGSTKRPRESSNSPNSDKNKRQKGTKYICPICMEVIKENTSKRNGDDAIFCENMCNAWLHRQCAGLSKPAFDALTVSENPFYCPHCRLLNYESQLSDLKESIKLLENKVTVLEDGLKSLQPGKQVQPAAWSERISSDNSIAAPVSPEVNNHITSKISDYLNEEKEKAKRRLNVIIHNVPESTSEDGSVRKKHDTDFVMQMCQHNLDISIAPISKCFRLGKKGAKPRLLKVSLSTEVDKAKVLRNCTKLRNSSHPPDVQKVFITPDLTPNEQKVNKELRARLKEVNKDERRYQIKNGQIVERKK